MNKKIIYPLILVVILAAVFGAGIFIGNKTAYHVPQPGTLDFSLFWDSYNKLKQNYVDPSKIADQKVLYGAIDGMTKSLGDPYTEFFDPQQAKLFESDLAGSFDGIGAEIGMKNDQLTIIAPIDGTPAQKAGLKSGDAIAKINGKDASNLTTDEAVSQIRGPKGTVVTLTIFRTGWNSTKDFKITRDTIVVAPVKLSYKNNGDTAYIQITQFDETLPADFKTAAEKVLQSKAKNIVLDLRGNPGGYLETAQNVAGWFLQPGQTVTIENFGKGKAQQFYKTDGNSELLKYPVVILMDQGSASASEILAGALHDNRGIQLIGTKSFGKGSVQQVTNLPDGSFLKITIAKWLTPKGVSISEVGLSPDVKIDITDTDIQNKKDPQLGKALEIVNTLK